MKKKTPRKRTNVLGQMIADACLKLGLPSKDGRKNEKGWGSGYPVARAAGISPQHLHDVVKGRTPLAWHHLPALAKALAPHAEVGALAAAWVMDAGSVRLEALPRMNATAALAALALAWPDMTPDTLGKLIEFLRDV